MIDPFIGSGRSVEGVLDPHPVVSTSHDGPPCKRTRVYVAAPLPLLDEARFLAMLLAEKGVDVVSSWHRGDATIALERTLDDAAMGEIGDRCLAEVERADALVLLYGPKTTRSGSVLETGYALGRGVLVVTVPQWARPDLAVLPTRLLHSPCVTHARTTSNALEVLAALPAPRSAAR